MHSQNKEIQEEGGEFVEVPEKAPWESKGWTREEWMRWHRKQQPDISSDSATLNPSWWVGKWMKFQGAGVRSLQEIWYFQKHMQLLI